MADDDVRGLVGEIVTRVRGPHAPGEVSVLLRGTWELLIAYGEEEIPRGSAALVTGPRGAGAVDVIRWSATTGPSALGSAGTQEE